MHFFFFLSLDLDAWINQPESEAEEEPKTDGGSLEIFYKTNTPVSDFRDGYQGEGVYEDVEDGQQVRREARRVEQANNPHYLKGSSQARRSPSSQLLSPAEEIPVVAITAFAMRGDEERIRDGGCAAYIAKPISVSRFLETMKRFLG